MVPRFLLGTLLIQAALAENVAAGAQAAQSPQPALERRVHDYKLTADSFLQALAKVAGDFQIPMGIE